MTNPNIGDSFDKFLKEEGILEKVEATAIERIKEADEEFDRCVSCDEETPYRKSDSVDVRGCYVEGAGQLCWKCWKATYGTRF